MKSGEGEQIVAEELEAGFTGWVEALAAELYSVGYGLYGEEEPEGYEASRDFLLSKHGLGGEEGFTGILPGFYLSGIYHGNNRTPGENLMYYIWETAWRELVGEDCALRVYSILTAHEREGEVIGLDLTSREGMPKGTVVFHERPHMADLICGSEADLRDLYR